MAGNAFACLDYTMAHRVPITTCNGLSRQPCKPANITSSRTAKTHCSRTTRSTGAIGPSLRWGDGWCLQILPRIRRGTMRSMGEGHALVILIFWRDDILNVPLHRLRRSPSPCRGGIQPRLCLNLGKLPSPPLGGEGRTAQPDGERGESADGRACAYSSLIAHGPGPLSPSPSPPEGGEGSLPRLRQRRG